MPFVTNLRPAAIHEMLVELNGKTGWDVPIHVDAVRGRNTCLGLNPK